MIAPGASTVGRSPPPGHGGTPAGRPGRGTPYCGPRQATEWQQVTDAADATQPTSDGELNDYPVVRQQLALPRGRGRGSVSPTRKTEQSPEPAQRGSGGSGPLRGAMP